MPVVKNTTTASKSTGQTPPKARQSIIEDEETESEDEDSEDDESESESESESEDQPTKTHKHKTLQVKVKATSETKPNKVKAQAQTQQVKPKTPAQTQPVKVKTQTQTKPVKATAQAQNQQGKAKTPAQAQIIPAKTQTSQAPAANPGEVDKLLSKLNDKQKKDKEQGKFEGTSASNKRLMKELKAIYNSDNYKNEMFTVEFPTESLYDWHVKLRKVDPDSQLGKDLAKLRGQTFVLLHFKFKNRYPFEPPFVRVVSPALHGGFVMEGGAICLELLTHNGWSAAYTIESVIMQISTNFTQGQNPARVSPQSGGKYSMEEAQKAFDRIEAIHKAGGWVTPDKAKG